MTCDLCVCVSEWEGGWTALSLFLAHYIIIIIIINIVAVFIINATTIFILTAQKERLHLVNERAIEKNPKNLCVCFSVLVYVFVFFSTGLMRPCKMNEA